jgi:hypothetical protein
MEKRFLIWGFKLLRKRSSGLKILAHLHSREKSVRNTLILTCYLKIHQDQCVTDLISRRLCHLTTLFTVLLVRIVLVSSLENLFYPRDLVLMRLLKSAPLRKEEKIERSQASIC